MKRVIFATGGAGYIGSHVVKELRKKGYRLGLEGRVDIVSGGVFNGGHNRPVKVLDLVEKIITLTGKKGVRPDIRGQGAGHGEFDRQWLDATKAKEILGWEPRVGLDEGLSRTIEWYRESLAEGSTK